MRYLSWGRYPRITPRHLHILRDEERLRDFLIHTPSCIAYGNGRSYGDSALNPDAMIDTRRYNRFLAFDPVRGIIRAQCGVLLSEILEVVVPHGWFLSITPGTKFITLGGAIASDVHGKNHHVAGCFSSCVQSMRMMRSEGEIVTLHPHDDLFGSTCGGMGLTGIILEATITLKPIRTRMIEQTTIKTASLHETFEAFERYGESPYSVAWIDCLARGEALGRSRVMVGNFAHEGELDAPARSTLRIPFTFPSWVLSRVSVKAFNALYYALTPTGTSHQRVDYESFFYPLDRIHEWNRIYGAGGFTQYQCIFPKEVSYEALHSLLTHISASGRGSFLAVLKLYGPHNTNDLSFPIEGYSLALDFKMDAGLFDFLGELDAIVLRYGGRLYLTKDVCMSEETFTAGYPQSTRIRAERIGSRFHSLQSQRIAL